MAKKDKEDDEFRPTGTIAVLAIFVVTLIAIWATIYVILVQRGGTL
ncbi:MAG: cytochrome c oxidase subunit 2A [Anaerolineales bacterium]|nr:cytochrome c oxidase subunit 2A [Anaerolineales bacterium]MCB9111912.1 cytochrome c oxidase subunit 2A [Anaerolineales bacterium]